MAEAIVKVLPILFFVIFGKVLEVTKAMKEETASQIKKGLIELALPAVLLVAFKNMELDASYLLVSVLTIIMLLAYFLLGGVFQKVFVKQEAFSFFATGTAFGLMGISLFESAYGLENLSSITIFGIGNEIFVWFFYVTHLNNKFGETASVKETVIKFIKSPIIISIFLGLLLNFSGFDLILQRFILYRGMESTFEQITSMSMPLILIVVGYGIKLEMGHIKEAMYLIVMRLIVISLIALPLKFLLFDQLFDTDIMFNRAYFTYMILPPPFVLSIYYGMHKTKEEAAVISTASVLSIIVSIVLFIVMIFVY